MEMKNTDMPEHIKDVLDRIQSNISLKKKIGSVFKRNVPIIILYLGILFVAFGHIANTYGRAASAELLFLWRYASFDQVNNGIPIVTIVVASFLLGFMDNFKPLAMKHGMWLGIFIIITSWAWHGFLHPEINVFVAYFGVFEGYLTLIFIISLCVLMSLVGNLLKQLFLKKKKEELAYLKRLKEESKI